MTIGQARSIPLVLVFGLFGVIHGIAGHIEKAGLCAAILFMDLLVEWHQQSIVKLRESLDEQVQNNALLENICERNGWGAIKSPIDVKEVALTFVCRNGRKLTDDEVAELFRTIMPCSKPQSLRDFSYDYQTVLDSDRDSESTEGGDWDETKS